VNYRHLKTAKAIILEYIYVLILSLSGKNIGKVSAISVREQGRWNNEGCINVSLRRR
jgi:hypothetical protein